MGFWKGYATGRGNRASSFERGAIGLKLQHDASKERQVNVLEAKKEQQANKADERAYKDERQRREHGHGQAIVDKQSAASDKRSDVMAEANRVRELAEYNNARKIKLAETQHKEKHRAAAESARLSEMQKVRAIPIRSKSKTGGHKRITAS